MTYREMAEKANPAHAARLASILLRIYEADRTGNCGAVTGEARLCGSFAAEARIVLEEAGVLPVQS